LGWDAGILAKDAMRHFWKIANRAIVVCAGKIFWESPGKNFWRTCFWKNLVKWIIAGVEIFADGISLGSAMK
jgi:aspartate/methionine/tyrosine aminotransferase